MKEKVEVLKSNFVLRLSGNNVTEICAVTPDGQKMREEVKVSAQELPGQLRKMGLSEFKVPTERTL